MFKRPVRGRPSAAASAAACAGSAPSCASAFVFFFFFQPPPPPPPQTHTAALFLCCLWILLLFHSPDHSPLALQHLHSYNCCVHTHAVVLTVLTICCCYCCYCCCCFLQLWPPCSSGHWRLPGTARAGPACWQHIHAHVHGGVWCCLLGFCGVACVSAA